MSKLRAGQNKSLDLGITLRGNIESQPVVSFVAPPDLALPHGHSERIEWIRQSYERFLAKVIEKEQLVGAPPTDIG